jgi:CRP/FNR family transcriptional regulator, dissimilatory nitrate respiration regulator
VVLFCEKYHLLQNLKIMPNYQLLSHSPIFMGLHPEKIEQLLRKVLYQVKKYPKDYLLANMGDTVTNLYIIQKGSVKGEMVDYSGKTLKIEDIEAPRPLATAFLFGNKNIFPVSVTTNNEVEIMSIPIPEFLILMQMEKQILINYLNAISSRTQFLSNKLHFLSFRSIKGKVAHYLLQEAGSWYQSIELNQTQQQLADLFGVTRPSLARVMGEMQREGIIRIERKTVHLLNKERLNQLLYSE